MRALFVEVLVEKLLRAGLGIAADCLHHFVDHVDFVVGQNAAQLLQREGFAQAYAELEEFVDRMIAAARVQGLSDLHEPTFFAALSQCGLIFWCRQRGG